MDGLSEPVLRIIIKYLTVSEQVAYERVNTKFGQLSLQDATCLNLVIVPSHKWIQLATQMTKLNIVEGFNTSPLTHQQQVFLHQLAMINTKIQHFGGYHSALYEYVMAAQYADPSFTGKGIKSLVTAEQLFNFPLGVMVKGDLAYTGRNPDQEYLDKIALDEARRDLVACVRIRGSRNFNAVNEAIDIVSKFRNITVIFFDSKGGDDASQLPKLINLLTTRPLKMFHLKIRDDKYIWPLRVLHEFQELLNTPSLRIVDVIGISSTQFMDFLNIFCLSTNSKFDAYNIDGITLKWTLFPTHEILLSSVSNIDGFSLTRFISRFRKRRALKFRIKKPSQEVRDILENELNQHPRYKSLVTFIM